jgi:hypothetical protein
MCPDIPDISTPQKQDAPVASGLIIKKRESVDASSSVVADESGGIKGGWSVGNAEPAASLILVHQEDPLPPFYDPTMDGFTGLGRNDMGSFVNGLPTIYLKVASYRDELCHLTLADAFTKANHPERLFVGIVEQACF